MRGLPLLVLVAPLLAAGPTDQDIKNPLYQQLRQTGVAISAKQSAPLPAPMMPDGLDAKSQKAVIKRLIGEDFDYSVFTDDSVNAPQLLLPLREVKESDPRVPARVMDVYFIAHGKRKKLADKEVLERLAGSDRNKTESKTLTADDLKKRGLSIPPEAEKHEGYGYTRSNVLDKVEVRAVGHSYWSETPESILLAGRIDERFANDPEFPNQWRSLIKDGAGLTVGPPHPYSGVGYYVKVTQLKEPSEGEGPGALFCEAHLIFTEPVGWFEGTSQLRSKLPTVVQDMVRKLRRELKK